MEKYVISFTNIAGIATMEGSWCLRLRPVSSCRNYSNQSDGSYQSHL